MKKKTFLFSGVCLLVSYLFLSMATLYAQDKNVVESKDNQPKFIYKVIRREGWSIPIPDENDSLTSSQTTLENQTITIKKYVFRKGIDTQLEMYSLNVDGSLNTGYQDGQLTVLATYSINGKVFACRMNSISAWTRKDGSRETGGIVTPLYYSDENGDGKFETRITGQVDTTIPAWVLATNK